MGNAPANERLGCDNGRRSVSVSSARMWVLVGEKFACIRIAGRASFSSSLDFKTLVEELRRKGYNYFVIDLAECPLMDSTFLGVLAGIGLKINGCEADDGNGAVELFNVNPRIKDLLENLGVIHLFRLTEGSLPLPGMGESQVHCPTGSSREELVRACLEAHQTLTDINPENANKFKDVTQFLAQDLQKLKANKP